MMLTFQVTKRMEFCSKGEFGGSGGRGCIASDCLFSENVAEFAVVNSVLGQEVIDRLFESRLPRV
jgi:hypothetical protein